MSTHPPRAAGHPDGGPAARERILEAAEDVFAERGFAAGTTKRIAQAAGVTEGLVFYYFGTKQGLLDALLEERSLGDELSELAAAVAEERDPRRLLRILGDRIREGLRQRERFARILLAQSYLDPVVRERLQTIHRQRVTLLAEALDEAAPGAVEPSRARAIAHLLLGSLLLSVTLDDPEEPEIPLEALVDALLPAPPAS